MFAFPSNCVNFARMERKEHEQDINPNLAFDLKDMDELRRQGRPISVSALSQEYFDGQDGRIVDLDPMDRRGVDINDAWVLSKESRSMLSKAKVRKSDFGIINNNQSV